MDPTMFAGLALAGLAAYGLPGFSSTREKTHKRTKTRRKSASLSGVKRRKRR